jgi:hypothetical protein
MISAQSTWAAPFTVTLYGQQKQFRIEADANVFTPMIVENLGPHPIKVTTKLSAVTLHDESAIYVVAQGNAVVEGDGSKARITVATPFTIPDGSDGLNNMATLVASLRAGGERIADLTAPRVNTIP